MVWWIETREISEAGKPTGRFRLTARSDEDGGGPYALCDCENGHSTQQEAQDCKEAKDRAMRY